MKFSVVIPYSQDYPNIWYTVQDKYIRLSENYDQDEYEVIIVNNGSTGDNLKLARKMCGISEDDPKEFTDHLSSYRNDRRLNLKYIEFKEQLSPKTAINVGAWKAEGDLLMVCDSHVLVNSDFFTVSEKFMDENPDCSVLHSPITYNMRDVFNKAYQYKLGVNEDGVGVGHLLGTWSTKKLSDKPYPISSSGTCSYVMRRRTFTEEYKGYPSMLRCYGAGEPYIDILAWMMGDKVYLHPDLCSTHFALTRSRGYNQGGAIIMSRNYMLAWYVLGGLRWGKIMLDYALEAHRSIRPEWFPLFRNAYVEAVNWGRLRRKHVESECVMSLEGCFRYFRDNGIYY